mmetsp:Transcript_3045/g.6324  ORF Transcript_3045/g.6324 Transcript_3045/m.6324 type:complete len:737 (-) Transcript_3045:517-2727(-)
MAESRRHARRFLLVGYSRTANPLALGVWHLYAVAPERPAQIPHVDDQDELHHHEHRADGADGDGVGLHEADHVVEKDDVAVDAERAKVLLALLLRKVAHPPVERVAHAGGGLKGRLGARDVSAELVARRVLRGPDDLRLRVGGLGVAGALRATRVARGNFGHAIEVWVAAAELVGTAGDTLNLGKELAAKAAVPTPAGRAVHHDRLAVHVVDRVDPVEDDDGHRGLEQQQDHADDDEDEHEDAALDLEAEDRGAHVDGERDADAKGRVERRLAHVSLEEVVLEPEGVDGEADEEHAAKADDDGEGGGDGLGAVGRAEEEADARDEEEQAERPHAEPEPKDPPLRVRAGDDGAGVLNARVEALGARALDWPGVALRVAHPLAVVEHHEAGVGHVGARVRAQLALLREQRERLHAPDGVAATLVARRHVDRAVVGDNAAARCDKVAALAAPPPDAVGRRVVTYVEAEVLEGSERDGRDGGAEAVRHDVVAHDARLPVRAATELGHPHQRQAEPLRFVRAVEVLLRQRVSAPAHKVPHLVGGAVDVGDLLESEQALARARAVARAVEHRVREAQRVDDLVDDEAARVDEVLFVVVAQLVEALDPREDEPERPALLVGHAVRAGAAHARHHRRLRHREHRVGVDAVGAVGRIDRDAAEHRAVGRARLFGSNTILEKRLLVPALALGEGERRLHTFHRYELGDLPNNFSNNSLHHCALLGSDHVAILADPPASLCRAPPRI